MNIVCPPKWIRSFFPNTLWEMTEIEKVIYLTFDDGPVPEITPWVLDVLREFSAKATFFCVGHNIDKHPNIFKRIIDEGHNCGNHTYNHIKGLHTNNKYFYSNILKTDELINTKLFRPPHGLITPWQCFCLGKMGFRVIMWNVLSRDYDKEFDANDCLQSAIDYTSPGAIVVFHDSIKAKKNLTYVLPRFLKHFSNEGYIFKRLMI